MVFERPESMKSNDRLSVCRPGEITDVGEASPEAMRVRVFVCDCVCVCVCVSAVESGR